jgi:purine-binding chemotaxis protein CheW
MTQGSINEFVTFQVDGQWLGVPVATVQEVLLAQRMAVVPLAPAEVAGFLNLRGQIVTALDLRTRLDMPGEPRLTDAMNVVVRHDSELFSLLVDDVGDVLAIDADQLEPVPLTLDPAWRAVSSGIVRRDTNLLAVLDVGALLRLDATTTA